VRPQDLRVQPSAESLVQCVKLRLAKKETGTAGKTLRTLKRLRESVSSFISFPARVFFVVWCIYVRHMVKFENSNVDGVVLYRPPQPLSASPPALFSVFAHFERFSDAFIYVKVFRDLKHARKHGISGKAFQEHGKDRRPFDDRCRNLSKLCNETVPRAHISQN
jgi:hypothetical protein